MPLYDKNAAGKPATFSGGEFGKMKAWRRGIIADVSIWLVLLRSVSPSCCIYSFRSLRNELSVEWLSHAEAPVDSPRHGTIPPRITISLPSLREDWPACQRSKQLDCSTGYYRGKQGHVQDLGFFSPGCRACGPRPRDEERESTYNSGFVFIRLNDIA